MDNMCVCSFSNLNEIEQVLYHNPSSKCNSAQESTADTPSSDQEEIKPEETTQIFARSTFENLINSLSSSFEKLGSLLRCKLL